MSESVKRALVAGHAEFAMGMISAVEQITGRGDVLVPIQVRGLCGDDIRKVLYDAMVETGVRVIFTDLQAGSCTMAARRVLREIGDGVLVAGTNLPGVDLNVYRAPELVLLVLGGLVIAIGGALLPAGWAAKTRTATALRTE